MSWRSMTTGAGESVKAEPETQKQIKQIKEAAVRRNTRVLFTLFGCNFYNRK